MAGGARVGQNGNKPSHFVQSLIRYSIMNHSRTVLATCAGLLLSTLSSFAAVQTDSTRNASGLIHFLNDKGEEKCTLPIPERSQRFDLSDSNETCENNMIASFWLDNVPSATLIQFYENESCSDAQVDRNFYFKFKTVKQPTSWVELPNPPITSTIEVLRHSKPGELLVGKYTRVEDAFVANGIDNLNERISCVYIERSQPVN